jgi:hypothetical protein
MSSLSERRLREDWDVREDNEPLRCVKTLSIPVSLPKRKSSAGVFVTTFVISSLDDDEVARFFEGRTAFDAFEDDDTCDEGVVVDEEAGRLPRGKAVGC